MSLRLYNTLTRTKEELVPLDPKNVRMYVCGPTVYDFAHIGNARPVIVFDLLFRLLRQVYGEAHVTYVRNITDVDDKINARAVRDFPALPLNDAIRQVTEKTARQYFADTAALGCLEPTIQPRATENIAEMQTLIASLIKRQHAYRGGRRGAVRRRLHARLWQALGPQPRGQSGRRPHRRGCPQEEPGRFRALEAVLGRGARLGQPMGQGAPRLAHRVLGHERALSRPGL